MSPSASEREVFAAEGKGAASKIRPAQMIDVCDRLGRDADVLVRASRTTAKVDNAAVQDGSQLRWQRSMLRDLRRDLRAAASARRAEINKWFFKTGPGEYGEGDRFLGVTLPHLRRIARNYQTLPSSDVVRLLHSKWHEERLLALFILVRRYSGGDARTRGVIHRLYLHNTGFINSWDLVDSSAAQIVGAHLENGDRRVLARLARSTSVWERRIAIIATYHYIRKGEFSDALAIAALLCHDEHDLIHKAVGWMLREIGKRNREVEERFLRRHAQTMPRTMLRYAVEKFPDRLRRTYLGRVGARGRRAAGPAASTGRLSRD